MTKRVLRGVAVLTAIILSSAAAPAAGPAPAKVDAQLAGLAVPFVANAGQSDPHVAYYAPTFAGTVFVTRRGEIVHALPGRSGTDRRLRSAGWTLTERFVGGHAAPVAAQPSATNVSLFLANDPGRWRAHTPTAAAVSLGEVYPGVRVQLKAYGKQVEKVFTVQPGAAVAAIRVRVAGAQGMAVTPDGALALRTGLGEVRLTRPVAYQEVAGQRHAVAVSYAVAGHTYGFRLTGYDARRPVVIDPLLQATYLGGGSGDGAFSLALNASTGEVYVAGDTYSTDFPGTSGGAQPALGGFDDVFVARLNPSLTALDQATYLGGSGDDIALSLALNASTGEVYVAGFTGSTDFPGTSGGAQPAHGGFDDAFVARLSPDLTALDQATYLGGSNEDVAYSLALNATTGEVYVAGDTYSTDFPGTSGGAQPARGGSFDDAFVARLSPDLTALDQATYLGGSDEDFATSLALNVTTGEVYVAGGTGSSDFPGTSGGAQPASGGDGDAYVARLNPNLTTLDQATYLGGSGLDYTHGATTYFFVANYGALALNATTGEVYVGGETGSTDFPGTSGGAQPAYGGGSWEAFVARLNPSLTTLDQATYLGGSGDEGVGALALNATTGEVYVAGGTDSSDFPGTSGGAQPAAGGGNDDAFVARLPPSLTTLDQATYLGGGGEDQPLSLALNATTGEVYVAGFTGSTDFPGTSGGAQPASDGGNDAFVARLSADLAAAPTAPPTDTATPIDTPTPTPTPTPTVTGGFVPPDANTGKCEDLVAAHLKTLSACMTKCQIKQADTALYNATHSKPKIFDEEACEQGTGRPVSCRTAYNNATTKLLGRTPAICPACLDATAQSNLADLVTNFIESSNGLISCAATTSLGGDDTGFVPPDANTGKCEDLVAGHLKTLSACMTKCQTKQADAARKGQAFNEEACAQGIGRPVSCRAAYNNATTKLLGRTPAICPACLDATAQSNLADLVTNFIENTNGPIYCAGTTPLP